MGEHIQKNRGKNTFILFHPCLSFKDIMTYQNYIFSEPTSLQSQKYLLSRLLLITVNEDLMKMLRITHWPQYLQDSLARLRAVGPRNTEHSLNWSWLWQRASVYQESLALKVSTPLPVRYPPLHLLQSSRMAKCGSVPREQKNTTRTSGSKKSHQVPSLTLISRTKSHCSKIGYFLYFSDASVGRGRLCDLRICPQQTQRNGWCILFREKKDI